MQGVIKEGTRCSGDMRGYEVDRGKGKEKKSRESYGILQRMCEFSHINPEPKAEIQHEAHRGLANTNKH